MIFLYTLLFFIGSVFLTSAFGHNFELALIIIGTALGFVTGKVIKLQNDLKALRELLSKDWQERHIDQQSFEKVIEDNLVAPENSTHKKALDDHQQAEYFETVENAAASVSREDKVTKFKAVHEATPEVIVHKETARSEKLESSFSEINSDEYKKPDEPFVNNISNRIKDYFTSGNLFVRIGIIILFFGVSFLLKYVSDRGLFPIEYRLIGVVIGAMALLGLGWRLRHKNETYALLLQGAGIGILYLDIYAAFSLYQLIPSLAAFTLLFIISMFSAALAVMQDSKSLAVLGFSGGFLAPVLASSGSNNHVGLFSYYAILNLAIVAVAWFKAWRPLNLLGFAFTFVIGTTWGVFSYNSSKFATTEPFLVTFFVFYVLIAVLYALRQPPKLHGYVDGTLLFGVPLAASALQYSLVKDFEYGISLSSFAIGAFYLLLSWFIWKRKGKGLKLLAEAFLALGVIFASMAIPFALAPTQTAAAWALEGAGLLWLGTRQNRLSVRAFGLLLQLGAGLIFIAKYPYFSGPIPFLNGEFISSMMMVIAGFVSARLLIKPFKGQQNWEKHSSPILLIWGLLWLFGGFAMQFNRYDEHFFPANLLLLTAITSFGFTLAAPRFKPEWKHAWIVAIALFPLILLMALLQTSMHLNISPYHPLQYSGWIAWPIVFTVYYFLLRKFEQHQVLQGIQPFFHSLLLLFFIGLITLEGNYLLSKQLAKSSDWIAIWTIVPATIALWLIIKAKFWPFSTDKQSYHQQTGVVLAAGLSLWSLLALIAPGKSDPLPWIPLLNPLDIMLVVVFITLFKWWKSIADNFSLLNQPNTSDRTFNQRVVTIAISSLVFLWINFTLFRIVHHWFDVPYQFDALYHSSLTQTAVSILWALSGVILTIYASRKQIRFLWLGGAVLLGLVVLKLFVIDLSTLSSLARIVSFLVVGVLLTSIGYFAPLPDSTNSEIANHNEESQDA